MARKRSPRCIIIAGPNGAGKTTFAQEFLPNYAKVVHFVNADLIAAGLSPLKPEIAAITAGRIVLMELDRLVRSQADFAFESTLSGVGYVPRLQRWKLAGYRVEIIYAFAVTGSCLASNCCPCSTIADGWTVYDNDGDKPVLIEQGP